jgi:hypothetical protein
MSKYVFRARQQLIARVKIHSSLCLCLFLVRTTHLMAMEMAMKEIRTSRSRREPFPATDENIVDLVRPTLPQSLKEGIGLGMGLSDEQERDYQQYRSEMSEYDTQRLIREIEQAELKLFLPTNLQAWTQKDLWALDEFIALSLGVSPEALNADSIVAQRNTLPRAYCYARRRELAVLAVEAGLLKDRDSPIHYLRWARKKQFTLPDELQILAKEGVTPDTKAHGVGMLENDTAELREQCNLLHAKVSEQAAELARLNKKKVITPRCETKELVIAGMALALGFDPALRNNPAIAQIKLGVEKAGHRLDDQTILNVVRRSCEMIRSQPDK